MEVRVSLTIKLHLISHLVKMIINQAIIKLNRKCNLKCTYCYYINDNTTRYGEELPVSTLLSFLDSLKKYANRAGNSVSVVFHGGEPLMMGLEYFEEALSHRGFHDKTFFAAVQTNATLLSEKFISLFEKNKVHIGISLDGPQSINDKNRVFEGGYGSYKIVKRAIDRLNKRQIPFGVLCVVNPEQNASAIYSGLRALGVRRMDFLPQMESVESLGIENKKILETKNFFSDLLNVWLPEADSVDVRIFNTMFKKSIGVNGDLSTLGGSIDHDFIILETNGTMTIAEEFDNININNAEKIIVPFQLDFNIEKFIEKSKKFYSDYNLDKPCNTCMSCEHFDLCGGGHPSTRYADGNFNRPSVYCSTYYEMAKRVKILTREFQ
ncbi:radical SAM protein [Fulvimarina sp. MAC3]|uniref:radical SAM protein n=1 Tax=Fulvimarina sp. MAC3 TaxID=3148887 RepID=UPI0031FD6056